MLNLSAGVTRRYWIQHKLGEGGMGEVYAALDRLTGTSVALKRVLFSPQQLQFSTNLTTTEEADLRRALAEEFRVLSSLRHPHIISVLDYGFDGEQFPYYTMTLLESPRDLLATSQNFTFTQRVIAFAQMLQALSYLHRHGILHRDLKPANVLMDSRDTVKLVDFGLASQGTSDGTSGTLAYMAPELIQQGSASPQSDLYAAGMLAYEMFTGVYPFAADNVSELLEFMFSRMPEMQAIPEAIQPIIARLLMKDPRDRYPDAEAVLSDLAAAVGDGMPLDDAMVRDSFLQAARFVGRQRELGVLTQALESMITAYRQPDLKEPIGTTYLIGGESGAGKSRLLEELRTHALLNGALVLRGQGVTGSRLPFQLWRDVVRRLLLEHEVTDLEAGILREVVPDIAALLERDIPVVPPIGAIASQSRLIETIVSLFQRQTQPMLLLLEDLQWAMDSLIPIQRLMSLTAQCPLMIVISYRSEDVPNLPHQLPGAQSLNLGRLTREEITELSSAMIGAAGKEDHLVEYLQEQSEGNVLFLVEVMRSLADDVGHLRGIGSKTLPPQVVAGGIQRIIKQRMDRLPAEASPALQLAAVAGRMLDLNLMHVLSGPETEHWLQAALEAAILDVVDDRWRFAHDRLRDAVLKTIPDAERPRYHHRIAEGLERLYPQDGSLAGVLFDHWLAAHEYEKAAHYAVQVARQRLHMGILNEGQQMLDQALALKPQDEKVLLVLYETAGELYFDLGKPQMSSEYHASCLQLARSLKRLDLAGLALEGMGNAAYTLGQYQQAENLFEESLSLRRSIGDDRGAASALHYMNVLYRFWGDYDKARACMEESIALRRKVNDERGLADSLYQLSVYSRNQGQFRQGITYLEEGRLLRLKIGDKRGLGDDLNSLGICYMLIEEFDQAQSILLECLRMRRTVNNLRGAASVLNALTDLEVMRGRYVPALRYASEALSLWMSFQEKWNIANSHAAKGLVQLLLHERHSARYNLLEGMTLAKQVGGSFVLLKALIGWARLLLLNDQPEQAALLLGLVSKHSAMTAQLRQIHLTPLLALVDVEVYASEFALGRDFDLNAMVDQILADEQTDLI